MENIDEQKVRDLILTVLKDGYLMSLGTSDRGGAWVSDVIYVHDKDFNIYWMSDPSARHSQSIVENRQAAGTITITNDPGAMDIGLQISGIAEKLEGPRLELEVEWAIKKKKKKLPIDPGEILKGSSWYVLHPKLIELIYEPVFGRDKQGLELGN